LLEIAKTGVERAIATEKERALPLTQRSFPIHDTATWSFKLAFEYAIANKISQA
jgi:hypothetical protein